jgi:hypothetical protein
MDATPQDLAEMLAAVDAAPASGAARLRAAVVANRLAQRTGDPWMADVAEALAEDEVPGATRALRDALREQSTLARTVRRTNAGAAGPTRPAAGAGVDASPAAGL